MVVSKGTPQLAGEIADSCNVISKDELKSLGVTIDRNLHFNEHISAPCKKVSVGVGVLMRMWETNSSGGPVEDIPGCYFTLLRTSMALL